MIVDISRLPRTRSSNTEAAYRKRIQSLRHMAENEARAGGDISDTLDWFCGENDRWAPSTVRQYRAAIAYALETLSLHATTRELLRARLCKGPIPKHAGPARTSTRKRKSLPYDEYRRLRVYLTRSDKSDDLLLYGLLYFGPVVFLRPVEYFDARVLGTTLIVRNAKATNGRANGETRERELAPLNHRQISALAGLAVKLESVAKRSGGRQKLHNRLSARLARVCKKIGIRRVSLYTLRHVGMATAKHWMSPEQVAAAAGHASVRTATTHYAKRRSGWAGLRLAGLPSPASIARVRCNVPISWDSRWTAQPGPR